MTSRQQLAGWCVVIAGAGVPAILAVLLSGGGSEVAVTTIGGISVAALTTASRLADRRSGSSSLRGRSRG
jgi:hypothetical protein